MSERSQNTEEVTSQNLAERRQKQASLRELKGRQEEALREARRIREKLHEEVVDMFWEEYFIGKHMVMEARDKEGLWNLPSKTKGIAKGLLLMRNSALKADEYIEGHNVEEKRPRSGRFLGEMEMITKRLGKAIKHFRKSVELFNKMDNWPQRVNSLELSGFLAEALIRSGKTQEGIEIAQKTFLAYDKGDGAELKKNDYYTWAVWKSGCVTKMWHGLLAKKPHLNERERLTQMLDEAEGILVIPEDDETWGDKNFEIRKDEIVAIREGLKSY